MTAIWRRLLLGWLVAFAIGAGGIGPALASAIDDGIAAYERGDYATALRLLHPLAEQGNATAQYALALMYGGGKGVRQNQTLAVMWFRLGAEHGDAVAQYMLGNKYYNGEGVPQNHAEAVKWYRISAERGFADAQYDLGVRYARGEGVSQNYIIAHMWLNLAASGGDTIARNNRDIVAVLMTPAQIAEAQKLAAEWKPKTWDQLKQQMQK